MRTGMKTVQNIVAESRPQAVSRISRTCNGTAGARRGGDS